MDYEQRSGNPYDFRSPVRHSALLAGRDKELAEIDELLRESALGRPVHISLFGSQGSGKSSLLNGVMDLATDRGFLAVKLPLREATVQTELDFYWAIYDAALQALLDEGQLHEDQQMMQNWLMHTCTGDIANSATHLDKSTLELGLVLAARLNNRMTEIVSTQVVERDLNRLLTVAGKRMQGLVLCLDSAELLDDNHDLAPSLLQLAECTPLLTIIAAAEAAGSLQKTAPRAWAQIEVLPFHDASAVLDAIAKPIQNVDDILGATPPTFTTAMDIRELTGGVPYEVSLVCHFIWDAIQQGEQERFDLSPSVIEGVRAELESKGRRQAGSDITVFASLSAADYSQLVELAPYEALTIHELALVRLMLNDYTQEQLESVEQDIRSELQQLEVKRIVRVEENRFELCGGRDSRIYLKYAAQRHTGRKLRYSHTYLSSITLECATHLGRAIFNDDEDAYNDALIFRSSRPQELGGGSTGDWLTSLVDAISTDDIASLAEYVGVWLGQDDTFDQGNSPFILLALHLNSGVHDVEHADLIANRSEAAIGEIRESAEHWIVEHTDLLSKYEAKIVECACFEVSPHLLRAAVAYAHLRLVCQASYMLYRTGAIGSADTLLANAIKKSEYLIGKNPDDPLLRTKLADALNRHGFIAATQRNWQAARQRLAESREMFVTHEWLLNYNEAYIEASQGDMNAASQHAASALKGHTDPFDRLLLHAYFPTGVAWVPPSEHWNVVELQGRWIKRFLELQRLVFCAADGSAEYRDRLQVTLDELSNSAPPAMLRLAAWAQLTILDNPDEAVALFKQAVAATPYDETNLPRLEVSHAEEMAGLRSVQ
jgi:AAA ATPase domain